MKKIEFLSAVNKDAANSSALIKSETVREIKEAIENSVAVTVRPVTKQDTFFLKVKVESFTNLLMSFETPANEELFEALLSALSRDYSAINNFIENGNHEALQEAETDFKMELFKQFLNSKVKGYREPDLIDRNGEAYLCVSFNIFSRNTAKFCMKKADVKSLWDEAIAIDGRRTA